MASPNSEEMPRAELAPASDEEPAAGFPLNSSPDPNEEPRPPLPEPADQAEGPEPGPHHLPPQAPNPGVAALPPGELLGLSFPRKLWVIAEDDTVTSVRWNDRGDTVIIEEALFQTEVLHRRGADRIFETDSLKSFIRHLNLYGFSKIRSSGPSAQAPGGERVMLYRNANFQRNKPLLLDNIQRKGDPTDDRLGTSSVTAKRKKQVEPPRHSLRIQQHYAAKGAEQRGPEEAPSARRPSGLCSGLQGRSNVGEQAADSRGPCELGGLSSEGTSRDGTFAPPAAAGPEGLGDLPYILPMYPDYGSVMSLYNSCYSILLAALSVMAPNESGESEGEGELEQEQQQQEQGGGEEQGCTEYKCALCEQFKDNPAP